MAKRLISRGVRAEKIQRIYNWSTYRKARCATDLPPEIQSAFTGRINFVYGGNIGQAQSLTDLVDATVDAARTCPLVHLHVFGAGIERGALETYVAANAAAEVTVHPPVNRDAMDRIFDKADVLIAQLKDDPLYEITIPSKIQHYLSCGRPIVAGLGGESAQLLNHSGAAIVCAPQDVAALANAMQTIAAMTPGARAAMGRKGAAYYRNTFNFDHAIDQTLAILQNALARTAAKKG